jgi:4-carboxymuconolactone decarboxylase
MSLVDGRNYETTALETAGMVRALEKFGEQGIMVLVAVNGYYDVVSMTLNVAHVAPPADADLPFKQAGR